MTEGAAIDPAIDPALDLVLERFVDVPTHLVWRAWTEPEHLVAWLTPARWSTVRCTIDQRPGGEFRTVMRSPEGEEYDEGAGCILEVAPNRRLAWSSALGPAYRPLVRHADPAGRERHEEMGFHDGWGAALDQLVAHAKTM